MAKKYEFRRVEEAEEALNRAKTIEEVAEIFGTVFGLPTTLDGMEKYTAITDALNNAQGKPAAMTEALAVAAQDLEQMAPNEAAMAICSLVKDRFGGWMEKPGGNFPLAILRKGDAEKIGAKVTVAVISAETMGKQKNHHPELTVEDYALAQEAIENGTAHQQGNTKINYSLERPNGVTVIVKATKSGNDVFVVSIWKLSGENARRERILKQLSKK